MKFKPLITLTCLGFAATAHTQELPRGSPAMGETFARLDGFTDQARQGKIQRGIATAHAACSEKTLRYKRCYRWTPFKAKDAESEPYCFLSKQLWYEDALKIPITWVGPPENGIIIKHKYDTKRGFYLDTGEVKQDKWVRTYDAEKIDCAPPPPIEPLILETITTSSLLIIPFSYDLEEKALENCILPEWETIQLNNSSLYDRTVFYCLETETYDDAQTIAASYKEAFSDMDAPMHKYDNGDKEVFYVRLGSQQLEYIDLKEVFVSMSIISSDKIKDFINKTGASVKIKSGNSAVLFAIDLKFDPE